MSFYHLTQGVVDEAENHMITLVTLVPGRLKRVWRWLQLKIIAKSAILGVIRRFNGGQQSGPGPGELIETLGFIHFGRWTALWDWWKFWDQGLPRYPGQPKEDLKDSILLFTSNFNDNWRPYVDTFTETSMNDMGVIWKSTPGWVNPTVRGVEQYFEFVDRHTQPNSYEYLAFRRISTEDIKSAIAVDREVRSFVERTATTPVVGAIPGFNSDAQWKVEYDRLLARVQRNIGSNPIPQFAQRATVSLAKTEDSVEITSIVPYRLDPATRPTDLTMLKHAILSLHPYGQQNSMSPFGSVPGTHFGRITVIDEVWRDPDPSIGGVGETVQLKSAYILLSVDADSRAGGAAEWLRSLHAVLMALPGDRLNAIWGRCYGLGDPRDVDAFVKYILANNVRSTIPFEDYPQVAVEDIERALTTHDYFGRFVFSHLDVQDAADLRVCFDAWKSHILQQGSGNQAIPSHCAVP